MYSVRNSCWYYACQLLLWLRFRCCGFQFVKVMPSTCHKTNTYVLIPLAVKEQESMLWPSDHRDPTHRNESFEKFKDGGLIDFLTADFMAFGLELHETQRKLENNCWEWPTANWTYGQHPEGLGVWWLLLWHGCHCRSFIALSSQNQVVMSHTCAHSEQESMLWLNFVMLTVHALSWFFLG